MRRVSLALIAVCVVASPLMAHRAGFGLRQNLDGSVCFPAPFYQYCHYGYPYDALDWYPVGLFNPFWNGMYERDLPQPTYTIQSPEPPPPPTPPPTPVLREYHWPDEGTPSPTPSPAFSLVTTSGTIYCATMVWVEGDTVHFNSEDGSVRQVPLSSISKSLTESANAQKHLTLRLPGPLPPAPTRAALPEEQLHRAPRTSAAVAN